MNTVSEFLSAIASAGLTPPTDIIPDGKLYRFASNGTRDDDAGWYVFHPDHPPAGAFGDWRTGIKETWHANGEALSETDRETLKRRWDAAKQQREADERTRHAEAAKRVRLLWDRGAAALETHPYLTRKRAKAHGLRVTPDGALMVPVCNADGEIMSLQFIPADGGKKFLSGGATGGGFHVIGDPDTSGPLCIAEGFATAASVHEATGYLTVIAFSASNLVPVAQVWRQRCPDRDIIVCADDDYKTRGNPGLTHATEAARAIVGVVAVPVFGPDRPEGATDFNDLARVYGPEVVQQIINAAASKACDETTFQRLAGLSPLEYERVRIDEAERLKIRVSALDKEIEARRPRNADVNDAPGSGRSLALPDAVPWPEPVDGAALLMELVAVIRRHVSLPPCAADAIAAWIAWAWMIERFDIAPRLAVLSPEKRCGKTTLLEILSYLVPRPLLVSGITPAAIFRTIEAAKPTLLMDEADTFTKGNEELRGILNSGHTRASATIIRTVGEDFEPRAFSTWCPMILAAIGSLPGTVEDRSIIIPMQRKAPGEKLHPFPRSGKRAAALRDELKTLARKVKRWADDNGPALADTEPTIPSGLNDRAADNWRPLLAIADVIGGEWPDRARATATALSRGASSDGESVKVQLLSDIKTIFDKNECDRFASQVLCDELAGLEERPWADCRKGKPVNPNQLARMLKPFGVASGTIRLTDGTTPKGYYRASFDEAFSRYLPEFPLSKRHTATSLVSSGDEPLLQSATPFPCGVSENARNPAPDAGCGVVADQNHLFPERGDIVEVFSDAD